MDFLKIIICVGIVVNIVLVFILLRKTIRLSNERNEAMELLQQVLNDWEKSLEELKSIIPKVSR